jgi:hypothetical protein
LVEIFIGSSLGPCDFPLLQSTINTAVSACQENQPATVQRIAGKTPATAADCISLETHLYYSHWASV